MWWLLYMNIFSKNFIISNFISLMMMVASTRFFIFSSLLPLNVLQTGFRFLLHWKAEYKFLLLSEQSVRFWLSYPSGHGRIAALFKLGVCGQVIPHNVRCVILVPQLGTALKQEVDDEEFDTRVQTCQRKSYTNTNTSKSMLYIFCLCCCHFAHEWWYQCNTCNHTDMSMNKGFGCWCVYVRCVLVWLLQVQRFILRDNAYQ